ncbi:MAG: hypothetical protein JWN84_2605 [Nocardioides sp.]|nr:hypothetical protein [Nocardioides sp.]
MGLLRLVGPAAATLVAAAGLAVPAGIVTAPPAHAAACSGATGVTVVADFNSLGGGVQGTCVSDGGGDTAASLFPAAGLPLSYAQRQPGFVCRVSGVPQSDPCVNTAPASAYWGLWWSDGKNGSWTYSSLGVGSLEVPDGGSVAFSWDDVAGDAPPSYTPPRQAAPTSSPQPTQQPSPQPTQAPTQQPGQPTQPTQPGQPGQPGQPTAPGAITDPTDGAGTTAPTPSTGPSTSAPATPTDAPSTPGTTATTPVPPADSSPAADAQQELAEPVAPTSSEAADDTSGGVPGWLAVLVIVLLFGIAGAVVLLQRRRTTP